MLTLDVLYAVLLGLPSNRLHHLDRTAWGVLCWNIERHLGSGADALTALKSALEDASDWQRRELRKALSLVLPVMSIPGLTYRQREALIALRYAKSASLTQLSHTLMADRSNTNRRLRALVLRRLAIRFSQPGGTYFMSVETPLSPEIKRGINEILKQLIQEYGQPTPHTSTLPT